MPATATQLAPSQEAGRPQPQTTVEPSGGPFIRYSEPGSKMMYRNTGNDFGSMVTQPLVSAPGYLKGWRYRFVASGGANHPTTTVAVTASVDAPFNVVSQVIVTDAFGTPLMAGPGFEMLYQSQLWWTPAAHRHILSWRQGANKG